MPPALPKLQNAGKIMLIHRYDSRKGLGLSPSLYATSFVYHRSSWLHDHHYDIYNKLKSCLVQIQANGLQCRGRRWSEGRDSHWRRLRLYLVRLLGVLQRIGGNDIDTETNKRKTLHDVNIQ